MSGSVEIRPRRRRIQTAETRARIAESQRRRLARLRAEAPARELIARRLPRGRTADDQAFAVQDARTLLLCGFTATEAAEICRVTLGEIYGHSVAEVAV